MALSDFFSGVSNFANNYIAPINNTVSTLYNAFGGGQQGGLLNLGGTLYNNYQNNQAINQAVNAIRDTSNQNLQTLRGVYDQGMQAASPYNQAGASALSGYQNLLQNPAQITNDPGYQFRFDQGAEALRRNMAATGFRGSGNELQALHEYGQNFATSELDKSLNRYTPLMNAGVAGLGATADLGRNFAYGTVGVNDTLGSAIAGGALADARNRTGLMSDFLTSPSGQGGNPVGSNPASQVGSVANAANKISGLLPGGSSGGALAGLGAAFGSAPAFGSLPASLAANAGGGAATIAEMAGFAPSFGAFPASAAGSAASGTAAAGSGATTAGGMLATAAPFIAAAAMPFALNAITGAGKRQEKWGELNVAANENPSLILDKYSQSRGGAAISNITTLIALEAIGSLPMGSIPQDEYNSSSIEQLFADTSPEGMAELRSQLNSAGRAGLTPADVAMIIYDRTTNQKTRAGILSAMSSLV